MAGLCLLGSAQDLASREVRWRRQVAEKLRDTFLCKLTQSEERLDAWAEAPIHDPEAARDAWARAYLRDGFVVVMDGREVRSEAELGRPHSPD